MSVIERALTTNLSHSSERLKTRLCQGVTTCLPIILIATKHVTFTFCNYEIKITALFK